MQIFIQCFHDGVSSKSGTYTNRERTQRAVVWGKSKRGAWESFTPMPHHDLVVRARFGPDGAPHAHTGKSFWIMWNDESNRWERLLPNQDPQPGRALAIRETNEAGALAVLNGVREDPAFRLLEHDGSNAENVYLPPSEVPVHTGHYQVTVNGVPWNPFMPIPEPQPAKEVRERPESEEPKAKKQQVPSKVDFLLIEVVGSEVVSSETFSMTRPEIKDFFSNKERFPIGKVQFETKTNTQDADAFTEIKTRKNLVARVMKLHAQNELPVVRATKTLPKKKIGAPKAKREKTARTAVTFVHGVTGDELEELVLEPDDKIPESMFPVLTKFYRAAGVTQDVEKSDVKRVEVKKADLEKMIFRGYTTILFYPPVRMYKARKGGAMYDPIKNGFIFRDVDSLTKDYDQVFRGVNNTLRPVVSEQDFVDLFMMTNNDPTFQPQMAYSELDSTSHVHVPIVWTVKGVEMKQENVPLPSSGFQALDSEAARGSARMHRRSPTPREVSEYSTSQASQASQTPEYSAVRSEIARGAVEIMRTEHVSAPQALQRSTGRNVLVFSGGVTIEDYETSVSEDSALLAAVSVASVARGEASADILDDLLRSSSMPSQTRGDISSASRVAGEDVERDESMEKFVQREIDRRFSDANFPLHRDEVRMIGKPGGTSLVYGDNHRVIKYVDARRNHGRKLWENEMRMYMMLEEEHKINGFPKITPTFYKELADTGYSDSKVLALGFQRLTNRRLIHGKPMKNATFYDFIKRTFKVLPVGTHEEIVDELKRRCTAVRGIVAAVLGIVRMLHDKRIMHGDLRPPNVGLHEQGGFVVPLLMDWALASKYDEEGKPKFEIVEEQSSSWDPDFDIVTFVLATRNLLRGSILNLLSKNELPFELLDRTMEDFELPSAHLTAEELDERQDQYIQEVRYTAEDKQKAVTAMEGIDHTRMRHLINLGIAENDEPGSDAIPEEDGRMDIAESMLNSNEWKEQFGKNVFLTWRQLYEWVSEYDLGVLTSVPATEVDAELRKRYVATTMALQVLHREYHQTVHALDYPPLVYLEEGEASEGEVDESHANIVRHGNVMEELLYRIFVEFAPLSDSILSKFSNTIFDNFARNDHTFVWTVDQSEEGPVLAFDIYDPKSMELRSTVIIYDQEYANGSEASADESHVDQSREDVVMQQSVKEEEAMDVEEEEEEAEQEEEEEEEEEMDFEKAVDAEGRSVVYILGDRARKADKQFMNYIKTHPDTKIELLSDIYFLPAFEKGEAMVDPQRIREIIAIPTIARINSSMADALRTGIQEYLESLGSKPSESVLRKARETKFMLLIPDLDTSPTLDYLMSVALPDMMNQVSNVRIFNEMPSREIELRMASWINVSQQPTEQGKEMMQQFLAAVRFALESTPRTEIGSVVHEFYKTYRTKDADMLSIAGFIPRNARTHFALEEDVLPSGGAAKLLSEWKKRFKFDLYFASKFFEEHALGSLQSIGRTNEERRRAYYSLYLDDASASLIEDFKERLSQKVIDLVPDDPRLQKLLSRTVLRFGVFETQLDMAEFVGRLRSFGLVHRSIEVDPTGERIVEKTFWDDRQRAKVLSILGLETDYDVALRRTEELMDRYESPSSIPESNVEFVDEPLNQSGDNLQTFLRAYGLKGIPPIAYASLPTRTVTVRRSSRFGRGDSTIEMERAITSEEMQAYLSAYYAFASSGPDNQLKRGIEALRTAESFLITEIDSEDEDVDFNADEDEEEEEEEDSMMDTEGEEEEEEEEEESEDVDY